MRLSAIISLLGPSLSLAAPAGPSDLQDRNLGLACLAVDTVVDALRIAPSAYPFCASYLGVEPTTVFQTATVTSVVTISTPTVTGTNTVTTVLSTVPTVTLSAITTTTNTITKTADAVTVTTCLSSIAKRYTTAPYSAAVQTPGCVEGLLPDVVSLACSCLDVPATMTSTITQTVHPTTVVTTEIAASATFTSIVTPFFTPVITPSETITVTPTATDIFCPAPTPDTSCGNQGLEWAYYPSPYTGDLPSSSPFDPAYFKTQTPTAHGETGTAGGISDSCPASTSTYNFYGNVEGCNLFVIDYRGYLYAGQTGDFTITITAADNLALVWVGPDAKSGWTRHNALIDVGYTALPATGLSTTYAASAGQYIPLRVMFANGGGPFNYGISVKAPDGTVVLSATSSTSEFLVKQSCDGIAAAPYPDFGKET